MAGPALGQEQLLQADDPLLVPQLESILKNVEKRQADTVPRYKQLFLVFAQDCHTGREHLLNGFEDQAAAEEACKQWQAQHRKWYQGFNNFTLFVRGLYLNKPGQGGLTADKISVLSADWE